MRYATTGKRPSSSPILVLPSAHETVDEVSDDEVLQRGVRTDWLDAEGFPTSAAFPVDDLKDPSRQGISVHRESPADGKTAPALLRWQVFVIAKAGAVRSIRSQEGGQAFEVAAAPTSEDVGHALVRFADPANPPASPRFERDKLLDVFRLQTSATD